MANDRLVVFNPNAYTTSHVSKDYYNPDHRGVHIVVSCTAADGASAVFNVEGRADLGPYYTVASSAAVVASGVSVVRVYPGLSSATGTANDFLPSIWRVSVTHSGGSMTYGVYANLED